MKIFENFLIKKLNDKKFLQNPQLGLDKQPLHSNDSYPLQGLSGQFPNCENVYLSSSIS